MALQHTSYVSFSHLQPKSGQDYMLKQNSIHESDICVCELWNVLPAYVKTSVSAAAVLLL